MPSGPVAETFQVIQGAVTEEYVRSTQGIFQFELSGKPIACAALSSKRHWVLSDRNTLEAVPKQTSCSSVLCEAPAAGHLSRPLELPSLCPHGAGVARGTGRSRGHGRSAGCHQLCEQSAASGLSCPRPQPVVLGASGEEEVTPCRAPVSVLLPRNCCERTRPRLSGGHNGEGGHSILAAFAPHFTLCPGDGGGTWYIDLKTEGGSAGFGKPPVMADVVMSMSSADFVKMFTGEGQRPLSRDTGSGAQKSLC